FSRSLQPKDELMHQVENAQLYKTELKEIFALVHVHEAWARQFVGRARLKVRKVAGEILAQIELRRRPRIVGRQHGLNGFGRSDAVPAFAVHSQMRRRLDI